MPFYTRPESALPMTRPSTQEEYDAMATAYPQATDGVYCHATSADGMVCTRPQGHDAGLPVSCHVAHGDARRVIGYWIDKPARREPTWQKKSTQHFLLSVRLRDDNRQLQLSPQPRFALFKALANAKNTEERLAAVEQMLLDAWVTP